MTPIIVEEDEDEEGGWVVADGQPVEDVIDSVLSPQGPSDEE